MPLDYYKWPLAPDAEVKPREIESLENSGDTHPSHYIPAPGLVEAVNVAIVMGMPLLVTGEPGIGKSELARSVAYQLGLEWRNLPTFVAKSTSEAKDLFYSYDAIGRFQALELARLQARGALAQVGQHALVDARNFVEFGALGEAILQAHKPFDIEDITGTTLESEGLTENRSRVAKWRHPGTPHRSVVLIDEIDKAPRDFPNDLLDELEKMYFRIPELGNYRTPALSRNMRPIVIVTSNSERQLPDAFLRRCLYFPIPFPPRRTKESNAARGYFIEDILVERLRSRWQADGFINGTITTEAIGFFYHLRDLSPPLTKRPATAELLNWLVALYASDPDFTRGLRNRGSAAGSSLVALLKLPEDFERGRVELANWVG